MKSTRACASSRRSISARPWPHRHPAGGGRARRGRLDAAWQNHQRQQVETHAEQLTKVLDDLDAGKDVKPPQLAVRWSGTAGSRSLRDCLPADARAEEKDSKAAIAGFGAIATERQPGAALSRSRAGAPDRARVRSAAAGTMIARLKPLTVSGGAWFGSAGEMLALASAQRQAAAGRAVPVDCQGRKTRTRAIRRAAQVAGCSADIGAVPAAKE